MMLPSCIKREEFPIEPYIEFLSFTKIQNNTGVDDKALMTIYFTDGDGDIGLREEDTLSPYDPGSEYYYNFIITYLEKVNGVYDTVSLPFTNNSRIPLVNPDLIVKPIKGEIEIELFINNPLSSADTIAFDVQLIDRALHKSNIIRTEDLYVKKN